MTEITVKKAESVEVGLIPNVRFFVDNKRLNDFANFILKGENLTTAAALAGFADPNSQCTRLFNRIKENGVFVEAMQAAGLSTFGIAKAAADALNAKWINSYQGESHETDYPDHRTRIMAARLAAEITDMIPDKQSNKSLDLGPNLSGLLEKVFETVQKEKAVEAEFEVCQDTATAENVQPGADNDAEN